MFFKYFKSKFNFRNKELINFREKLFYVFNINDRHINNRIIIDEITIFLENFI